MLNTLYFVRDAEYHDLKSSIIVYENDHTGIEHVGLNSSGLSRSFVGEFLDGALSVGENVFLVAKGDYRNSHVNELSNLCGLYLHGKHDQLIELQNEYSQFALDVKKVKIKSRAGKGQLNIWINLFSTIPAYLCSLRRLDIRVRFYNTPLTVIDGIRDEDVVIQLSNCKRTMVDRKLGNCGCTMVYLMTSKPLVSIGNDIHVDKSENWSEIFQRLLIYHYNGELKYRRKNYWRKSS